MHSNNGNPLNLDKERCIVGNMACPLTSDGGTWTQLQKKIRATYSQNKSQKQENPTNTRLQ